MLRPHVVVSVIACLLGACTGESLDQKVVGSWTMICSMDICTIITFAPDHTYAQRFEDSDSPYLSGTWRTHDRQLAMRMLSTRIPEWQDKIGEEQWLDVSALQDDSLVVTYHDDQKTALTWTRAH